MGASFAEAAAGRRGCAVIFAGSDSDRGHVEKIVQSLEGFGIPHEVRICSAHKEPERLMSLLREYERLGGAVAYIAVAGGTDALSGTLSFHALAPVISCPPDAPNPSCLSNPPGSSNAVIYDPRNVGRFVAQLFAAFNPELAGRLKRSREEKVKALESSDRERR
jgi:5-(carboxyamino)imidazole ribonucleotide mutase